MWKIFFASWLDIYCLIRDFYSISERVKKLSFNKNMSCLRKEKAEEGIKALRVEMNTLHAANVEQGYQEIRLKK